jgi:hypothetical protein
VRRAILAAAVAALAGGPSSAGWAAGSAGCRFDVAVSARLVLDVAVDCAGTTATRLSALEGSTARYITAIEDLKGRPLQRDEDAWRSSDNAPLAARYRLELGAMGATQRSHSSALAVGQSVLAELSSWLLMPGPLPADATLRLSVQTAPGIGFASALAERDGLYELEVAELRASGYSVFGQFRETMLAPPGPGTLDDAGQVRTDGARRTGKAKLRLVTLDQKLDLTAPQITQWVTDTTQAVARFWHGFPVDRLMLVVVPQAGRAGVPYGRVVAGGGATLMVQVGENATAKELYDDWVLIHEFVHVGSPFVLRSPWMTEGLATYFEPIIRFRAGRRDAASLWAEFARDMPRGQAALESEGLAYSRRGMYWGGAILMLLIDLDMRERSQGRRGLEDCLRAILAEGGNATRIVAVDWMVDACDRADGGDATRRLTRRYAWSKAPVDLDEIWRRLGVVRENGSVRLDDTAPLAWLRRAIESGRPTSG